MAVNCLNLNGTRCHSVFVLKWRHKYLIPPFSKWRRSFSRATIFCTVYLFDYPNCLMQNSILWNWLGLSASSQLWNIQNRGIGFPALQYSLPYTSLTILIAWYKNSILWNLLGLIASSQPWNIQNGGIGFPALQYSVPYTSSTILIAWYKNSILRIRAPKFKSTAARNQVWWALCIQ